MMETRLDLSVAIQAGGASRRMGQDKALMSFRGVPMVQRVAERLHGLGCDCFLAARSPEPLAFLGLPCVVDRDSQQGALGGLRTALAQARCEWVAVVACDMPFASPELFRLAFGHRIGADLVVFRSLGGLEPMHALYRKEPCLHAVEQALARGQWRVDAWFPEVALRILEPRDYAHLDPRGQAFRNVNTPEDLAQAEAEEA